MEICVKNRFGEILFSRVKVDVNRIKQNALKSDSQQWKVIKNHSKVFEYTFISKPVSFISISLGNFLNL